MSAVSLHSNAAIEFGILVRRVSILFNFVPKSARTDFSSLGTSAILATWLAKISVKISHYYTKVLFKKLAVYMRGFELICAWLLGASSLSCHLGFWLHISSEAFA